MTESARLVITVDSTQAKSAETDLLRMANASGEAQRATSQVEAAAKSAAVGLGSFRDAQGRITDGSGKLVTDLRKAEAGLDDMSSAVKKLSSSADTLKFQSLNDSVSRVTSSIDPFKSAVEENAKKLLEAADGSNVFEEALGSLGEKASATGTLIKAALSFAGAAGIQGIIAQADAYGQMSDRLKMASDGTEEYSMVQSRLLESANRTYRPLEEAQELYIRTADSLRSMGAETKDVLDITDSFSYLMVTNAASADSASSAISAYSKAIQTGKVDSDGWQSILAATPTIVNSIAESTGKTTAEIRKLGIEGKLSVTDLNESLRKTAEANGLLADSMSTAVSDAMTKLSNSTKVYIGTSNESLGATDKLAAGIGFVADNIDVMASVIAGTAVGAMTLYTAKAGLSVAASIAGRAGNIALAQSAVEVAVANQLAARSATALAASNLAGATTSAAQTEMSAVLAASRIAEAQATGGVIAAQAGLRTASLGVLGVLGGPVGIAVLAGAAAASYLLFRDGADAATSALIDQNGTLDDSIQKFRELSVEQQRFQSAKWAEAQESALDSAASSLAEYASRGSQAFNSLGMSGVESAEAFRKMVAEVKAGTRSLDSVTEWVSKNNQILPTFKSMLEQTAAAYSANGEKAEKYGKLLAQSNGVTTSATTETEKLAVAQIAAAQSSGAKAGEWDKYIAKLTETRDLLGANAAAEAEYNAVKMGANSQQLAQAKLIGEQTVVLKAYQEAVKDGNKVEQAALKTKLLGLYTAEEAATQAATIQKQAYADTATAAENSAKRQVTAIEQAANFAIASAARMASGTSAPAPVVTGYSLLTSGGTPPVVVPEVKETALERVERAIKLINEGTEANKNTDKAANAAAKAIESQAKALKDFEAQSAISTKSSNDMADAYLAGADSVRELAIQQKIEEELLKTGAGARDAVTAAVNREADAKDRLDIDQSIASIRVETTNTLAQATATLQGSDALETFNIQKSMSIALSGKKIDIGSKEYEQLLEQTKAQLAANKALEQASKVEGIVDRLNPQIKLLKDYTAERDALNAAMIRDSENVGLYQDALAKLGQEYEVNQSKATIWGQLTEGAIDRIDGVFADAWANIGSGANSLWDNLVKGAKQAFGEIAHMLTTKPLLASISNWLTGTDNGQGIGSVWSKLLGGASGSSSNSGGGLFGSGNTLVSMGKSIYQAYSAITGVGSSIASGYASGGIGGAISGGVGYYGNLLSSFGSTLSSGFSGIVGAITGSTATQVAANAATSAALQGAVAQGAAQVGTSIGIGGAAAAGAGTAAAAGAGAGFYASLAAMASNPVGWVIAAVTSAYQSGKLYDQGVRWNTKDVMNTDLVKYSGGIGQATLAPLAVTNNVLEKIVGGKMAAIFSGSTFASAIITKVSEKIFGGSWQTKDGGISLGVENGELDAQQYIDQKKKGGLFSSSKKRTRYSVLDAQTAESMAAVYDATEQGVIALVSRIGISANEGMFDGLNIAKRKLSTQGKTGEEIQKLVSDWFSSASDQMVGFLDGGTGGFGYSFAELAQRIASFETFNDTLDTLNIAVLGLSPHSMELANSLIAAAGGMEAFQTATNTYYDNFFSESEKADDVLSAVTKQFAAMGVTLPGTRDAYRGMVEALDMTTASGQSMFMTLTSLAGNAAQAYSILEQRADAAAAAEAEAAAVATAAAKELADALKEALMGSVSSAMSAVQRAISAQQQKATEAYNATNISLNDMVSTVTENVNGLNSVSSSLSAALKALRGDSDDAVKMLRAQAQATLQSALATAKAGGSLSGLTGLEDALDTVGTNTTDLYSSLEDFNRDQGRTANVVAELNGINGKQLTTAEKSLKGLETQIELAKKAYDAQMAALDNQLAFAQAQMDALNGVDNSVQSVAAAVQQMNAAVVAALAGQDAGAAMQNTYDNNVKLLRSVYQAVLGRDLDGNGLATWTAALANGTVTYGNLAQTIATGGRLNGETVKIPGYAAGGDFGGGLRLVGENGPELEVTGPSRIYNANQTAAMLAGGNGQDAANEVRQLRAELKSALFAIAKNTLKSAKNTDLLPQKLEQELFV